MALKLYGCVESFNGIEFMVRADTRDKAQETADALVADIQTAGTLFVEDFGDPVEILTTYKSDSFAATGPVNGGSLGIQEIVEEFEVLRLDGSAGTFAFGSDEDTNNPLGEQNVIVFVQFDTYQGKVQTIASKWNPFEDEKVWALRISTLGFIQYEVSSDGDTSEIVEDTNTILGNGAGVWIKAHFDPSLLQISISIAPNNEFVALEDLTFTPTAVKSILFTTLRDDSTAGIHMGAEGDPSAAGLINTPTGFISRAVIGTPDLEDEDFEIVSDMFPDRDAVPGTAPWTYPPTGETWSMFGNADIGLPIVGGPIKAIKLDGTSGSYASAPDDWPLDKSFTVAAWIQSDEIQFSYMKTIASKDSSWSFEVESSDKVGINAGNDTLVAEGSGYKTGEGTWTAVYFDIPNTRVHFYRSDDSARTPYKEINWVKVKAEIVPNLTTVKTSDADICIGEYFKGDIARFLYMDGELTGELYRDMYPDRDHVNGESSFTSATTGEEWVCHGDAIIGNLA